MPDARFPSPVTPIVPDARVPVGRSATEPSPPSAPPPRPELTHDVAPLGPQVAPPRPRALLLCAGAWLASCAAGALALLAALADYDRVRAQLTAAARAHDPAASVQLIESGVRATVLVAVVPCLVVLVATVVWAVFLLLRRAWARWALLVSGPVAVLLAVLAEQVVGGGGRLVGIAFALEATMVGLGLLTLLAGSSRAWLFSRRG